VKALIYILNHISNLFLLFIYCYVKSAFYKRISIWKSDIILLPNNQKNVWQNKLLIFEAIWLKSAVIIYYTPPTPNIWQTLIRGHVQMNSWSANENATGKILTAPFKLYNYHIMNAKLSDWLKGPSWSWSHGSWIYNYLCNQFLSTLKLWVQ